MSLKTMLGTAGTLCLIPLAVFAQAPPSPHLATEPFVFKSGKELEDMTTKPGAPSPVTSILSDHENYYVQAVARTQSGEPEFHTHWIDYGVVQEGQGNLIFGGSDTGSRDTGSGELRGGAMSGSVTRDLNPGDYFEIPAGQWHQMTLKPGTKVLRVLVMKVRQ